MMFEFLPGRAIVIRHAGFIAQASNVGGSGNDLMVIVLRITGGLWRKKLMYK